jgi:hypothetical protein
MFCVILETRLRRRVIGDPAFLILELGIKNSNPPNFLITKTWEGKEKVATTYGRDFEKQMRWVISKFQ